MAKIILIYLKINIKYWENIMIHLNYIRNQVITRVLKRMTQNEKFWAKKPDLY
jgi:hypothetical protein